MESTGGLVAGVAFTFDIFTMNSERSWDMSSVDERDYWVPGMCGSI